MRKQTSKKKQRPILSPAQEGTTFLALGLGQMGFSADAIAHECGISPSAVYYRLGLFGIKLKDYRAGESEFSHELRKLAKPLLGKRIKQIVEKSKL